MSISLPFHDKLPHITSKPLPLVTSPNKNKYNRAAILQHCLASLWRQMHNLMRLRFPVTHIYSNIIQLLSPCHSYSRLVGQCKRQNGRRIKWNRNTCNKRLSMCGSIVFIAVTSTHLAIRTH